MQKSGAKCWRNSVGQEAFVEGNGNTAFWLRNLKTDSQDEKTGKEGVVAQSLASDRWIEVRGVDWQIDGNSDINRY